MVERSRRDVLTASGSVVATGLGGCLSGGETEPRYQLTASAVPGSLAEGLRWEPRESRADPRGGMARLVETGSLTTLGGALLSADPPRYVEHEGTYYEVTVARPERVERERWVLWFDLIEGDPPRDAEVFTSSLGTGEPTDLAAAYDLSERDVDAVEDAAGAVPTEFGYRDLESEPPGQRGHVFLDREPEESALLPEPPFSHVAYEDPEGTRYARAVAERTTVEVRQYRHEARQVAESPDAYESYVRDRHLRATVDRAALPDEQRTILDRVVRGGGDYEERVPLSSAYRAVLDRLGLTGIETPEPRGVEFSEPAYFRYRGGHYAGELVVHG